VLGVDGGALDGAAEGMREAGGGTDLEAVALGAGEEDGAAGAGALLLDGADDFGEDTGERGAACEAFEGGAQLLLAAVDGLAGSDVEGGADEVEGGVAIVADDGDGEVDPAGDAVLGEEAFFDAVVVAFPGVDLLQHGDFGEEIGGVGELAGVLAGQLFVGVADEFAEGLVDELDDAGAVAVGDGGAAVFEDGAEAAFAGDDFGAALLDAQFELVLGLVELGLETFAFGNVEDGADTAERVPLFVAEDGAAIGDEKDGAVLAGDPVLEGVAAAGLLGFVEAAGVVGAVFGVDEGGPVGEVVVGELS